MTVELAPLDKKINDVFPGVVVRKDLVKKVKGNAIVPSYVLEYLLGQYCATTDEDTINTGIETVKEILAEHYVHRRKAPGVRSTIKEKGRFKVIDKITVDLNDKLDIYEATFSNLGIDKVMVTSQTIKQHPKLLIGGVWCIADLEYRYVDEKEVPWILETLKPIQLSQFDLDQFVEARNQFSTEEWIDVLLQSIGLNPEVFGARSKMLQLVRLIPFCERNYNLMELGPKGTGKSHIYSEFSPHGMLISGGEVTVPKLFVNNANGKLGLVGYWDCVAFDEFAGKGKRIDKALVDIMKNYMANKSFSRGIETLNAEASMAFVGNTKNSVAYMLRNSDLFEELPDKYHDSAFLDRVHFFVPGWEIDNLRNEMFTEGFGFVVDYLAEVLKFQRDYDYSNLFNQYFELSDRISTRDRDAIKKTFSGLMKIIYPNKSANEDEVKELLTFAMEGRKRVKDQLLRIDDTFTPVDFIFLNKQDEEFRVSTLEEEQYPALYHRGESDSTDEGSLPMSSEVERTDNTEVESKPEELQEGQTVIKENQKGVDFDTLFGPYLKGCQKIVLTDPYIRNFHQARYLMEFVETVIKVKPEAERVALELITVEDEFKGEQQKDFFQQIQNNCLPNGVLFSWEFRPDTSLHARHIVCDNGWKIGLDRGLDVFQPYDWKDAFALETKLQKYRKCKPFEVTYIKTGS